MTLESTVTSLSPSCCSREAGSSFLCQVYGGNQAGQVVRVPALQSPACLAAIQGVEQALPPAFAVLGTLVPPPGYRQHCQAARWHLGTDIWGCWPVLCSLSTRTASSQR